MGNIRTGSISAAFNATKYTMLCVKATRSYVDVLALHAELRTFFLLCPGCGRVLGAVNTLRIRLCDFLFEKLEQIMKRLREAMHYLDTLEQHHKALHASTASSQR